MERRVPIWLIAIVSMTVICSLCEAQEIALPKGWRTPSSGDTKNKWRDREPNRHLWFRADLNGDGIQDQANILISNSNDKIALFAFVSQKDGKHKAFMLEEMDISLIEEAGISLVLPGRYKTLYGSKDIGCLEGKPCEIVLSHDGINLFFVLLPDKEFSLDYKSSRFFFWFKNKFSSVWMYE
jgi:hypothetical protein